MHHKIIAFIFLVFIASSCQEDNKKRLAENKKDKEKREILFNKVQKAWVFNDTPINETADSVMVSWTEFRQFLDELGQKPKKTIGAFQKKSAAISNKVMLLNSSIPPQFNQPQIKSRIATLITKVRMMDLFIHLDDIPDKKVSALIVEINNELISLQRQMGKIVDKSKIPIEEGEAEMRRMLLDSARAIPSGGFTVPNMQNRSTTITPQNQNIPRVE